MNGGNAAAARDPEEGAYAILYATLMVFIIALAAVVVDLSAIRQDRRADRAAADAAAIGGASKLNPNATGSSPREACLLAWKYLATSLSITVPSGVCNAFNGESLESCPTTQINDTVDVGRRRIRIAWPIPRNGTGGFLDPDLAPGSVGQPFSAAADGTDPGCDRLGVSVREDQVFGLAPAFGISGGTTEVHSVARLTPHPETPGELAALNILNLTDCQTLTTSGQGFIVVNRATDDSRGVIADESAPTTCGSSNKFVIDPASNNLNRICASGPDQVPDNSGSCDGEGKIETHARDAAATEATAYNGSPGPVANGVPLYGHLVPEGGVALWDPVAQVYGCASLPRTVINSLTITRACGDYPPYISDAYSDLDSNTPTPYSGVGTYSGTTYGATFTTLNDGQVLGAGAFAGGLGTFRCVQSSALTDSYYVPPGNWYVDCPDGNNTAGFQPAAVAQFGGGQLVFRGGIRVAATGSCFAVNVPRASLPLTPALLQCPLAQQPNSITATTDPPPTQEALMMVRGRQGFTAGAGVRSILLPQTAVLQASGGLLDLGGGAGTLLWTAPGGGTVTGGATTLETLCTSGGVLDQTCLDSRLSKIAYWNETRTTGNEILGIGGQGALALVGVFFSPRADFVFTGQAAYTATNAQFWVDTLAVKGQGGLGLTPSPNLGIFRNSFSVSLIR